MQIIAIVDDDIYIGNMLENVLKQEGYQILRAFSGTEALLLFSHNKPDLILLDLMLPGLSGEELLPKIKGIPVIIMSAKVDVQDKVNCLLDGAVDYITKPFDTRELLARITVHLRNAAFLLPGDTLTFQNLTLHTGSHEVQIQDTRIRLTRTEYAILKLLMQNPDQVITKTVMLDRICEDTPDCMESSLKVHISNLRKKLRDISNHDYIETVWGIGFKLQ